MLAGLALAVPAVAAINWRLVADGVAHGAPVATTTAYVALDRAATSGAFSARLPAAAKGKVAATDFSKTGLVVIYGEFGCRDSLIAVSSLEQHGTTLTVTLAQRQAKPGTAVCMAIFATYRILSFDKTALRRPYPTRATVTLAPA